VIQSIAEAAERPTISTVITNLLCGFVTLSLMEHNRKKISALVQKIWWSGLKPRKRNKECLWAKLWTFAVLKHSRLISNRRFHNPVCKTPYYFGNTHSKFIHLCFAKSKQKQKLPAKPKLSMRKLWYLCSDLCDMP